MRPEEYLSSYTEVQKFFDLLQKTIGDVLDQVFGENTAKVIYNYLETTVEVKWTEIGERPKEFSAELKKLLGSGASNVEILILKKLYSHLHLEFVKRKDHEFSDYIKELRSKRDFKWKIK